VAILIPLTAVIIIIPKMSSNGTLAISPLPLSLLTFLLHLQGFEHFFKNEVCILMRSLLKKIRERGRFLGELNFLMASKG